MLIVLRAVSNVLGRLTDEIKDANQSDILYMRLCQAQESFRARLTPKPWRCGVKNPPNRFPWEQPSQENLFRSWQQQYEQSSTRFGVCHLVRELGDTRPHPRIAPVLALHDQLACSNLPLA